MSKRSPSKEPWLGDERVTILVEDAAGTRPFMPGYLIHSLVSKGHPFDVAWRAAHEVARDLEGCDRISRAELAERVRAALAPYADQTGAPAPETILIKGHGDGLPFSKGILAQSLMATAIEPSAAFEVAREIETDLIASRAREIGRKELSDLAFRALSAHEGHEAARRYRLWRKYQEPDQPVILLIGGTSGVGKTSLALEVARRLGIGRVLSTDSIRQMMRIMLSADFAPAIHGSSYDCYKLLPREAGRRPTVIDGFRAQAATVSVGVRASVERTISESANIVIDGVSVQPGAIDPSDYSGRASVIPMLVATTDEETLRNRFIARANGQKNRLAEHYLTNLDGILAIQRHLIELADLHHVPVIDNESFDTSARSIIDHVMGALGEASLEGSADDLTV